MAGVLQPTGSQEDDILFLDLATAQRLWDRPGEVSFVEVSAWCSSCPIEDIGAQISTAIPGSRVSALRKAIESREILVGQFRLFSIVVSAFMVIAGGLVVLASTLGAVRGRRGEIGVFRALGFRRRHVMEIVLLENLIVGVAASVVGVLLAVLDLGALRPPCRGRLHRLDPGAGRSARGHRRGHPPGPGVEPVSGLGGLPAQPSGRSAEGLSGDGGRGMGLNTIAVAHLGRHKGKSVLIIVGLATAVAAFVAVMSLVLSLQTTLDGRLARYGASLTVVPQNPELSLQYGGITVATAGSAQTALLDPAVVSSVEGIQSKESLAAVLPVALRAVNVSGADYLAIGTDIAASARVKPWWRVEGALPTRPDEVLLGLNARNKLRAEPGTSLTIGGRPFVVSGVLLETGGEEDNAIIMDRTALAQATGTSAELNMIEVAVTDSGAVDQVVREIQAAVPGVDVRSVKQSLEFNAQAGSSLADIGLGATVLIVLIATLIVVLTMLAAVRERQREIGVFRAVGFRDP